MDPSYLISASASATTGQFQRPNTSSSYWCKSVSCGTRSLHLDRALNALSRSRKFWKALLAPKVCGWSPIGGESPKKIACAMMRRVVPSHWQIIARFYSSEPTLSQRNQTLDRLPGWNHRPEAIAWMIWRVLRRIVAGACSFSYGAHIGTYVGRDAEA
jgi:hypothetical protein